MLNLENYLNLKQNIINNALENIFSEPPPKRSNRLIHAMSYSLLAGGKRLRPILFLGALESLGLSATPSVLTIASSLELIHTYSLIHDDLPAMDNDDLRRGKPTCHIQFDEATAILAGDALLTHAFCLLSEIGLREPEHAEACMKIIYLFSVASGYKGMVIGQMLDLANEGKVISREALEKTHSLKTGALIRAAVVSGAILGHANQGQMDSLEKYSDLIGLAFQVMDDLLNIEGDPSLTGKAVGSDLERKKCTFPSLLGIEGSKEYAHELVNNALHALAQFDTKADPLRGIALYIINRKK
jgi:geranylgeranyl diphosphate synthase, type II